MGRTRRRRMGRGLAGVAVLSMMVAGGYALPARVSAAVGAAASASCPWLNQSLPVPQRVSMLVSAMSLDQKIAEMHAFNETSTGPYAGYEGYVPAQPSLCIPALPEQDDSQGVGTGAKGVTQLPASVSLASAWDPSLARQYGVVNGAEHWGKGIPMALGPGVNIQRDPRWGRNFEMFSEDPYLSSSLIVPDVEGIQSQHVMADLKHYVAYNQETNRNTTADNDVVSSRVLHEIYMPGFEAGLVKGDAASVMCSYASLNHIFGCENPDLLTQVLRDDWGYQGFVRSDGGANHSTAVSANAGLDQEKGSNYWGNGQLAAAVADGQVSTATINAAVSRIFTPMFQLGIFNDPPAGKLSDTVTTRAHAALARQVAEQGTVLLKDSEQILPLGAQTGSIAVIGPDGTTSPMTAGGGSANVTAPYQVSPLQGIQAAAPKGVSVTSYSGTDPSQAAAAAKAAKVAIVFASNYESEGSDLSNITLQNNQDAYIEAVAAANPDTIVVLNTGGPVAMPWLSQVKGVLEGWYAGQEDGNALAAVLFGTVNPSGHLPETFPASLSQVPASTSAQWPGVNGQVDYSEGLDVGYRWYDAKDITPSFPFGYGLSYTTFKFSDLSISPEAATSLGSVHVAVTVTNTGSRSGADVAQLYVGDPASAGEPPRQLQGFKKVSLAPGQSARVHFTLTSQELSYYDTSANAWTVPDGTFRVYVGDSSAMTSLPLHGAFQVTGTTGTRHATLNAPGQVQAGKPFTVTATLTGGGDLAVHGAQLALSAPAGWEVSPASPATAGTLAPGQAMTASWRVTAPAGAQDNISQLSATATYQAPGGTGTSSTHAQVTVNPLVTTTVTPHAAVVQPGKPSQVTLTSTDTSGYPVHLAWAAAPPSASGITFAPASGSASLAPGASTSSTLTVTGSTPGTTTVPIRVTATADGATVAGPGANLGITVPYTSLSSAYNNTGVTADSDHTPGDFDGYGNTYSAQALAAAGVTPGSAVTANGVTFTWPDVPGGQPDNVVASGQTIAVTGSGSTLGFLGAADNGNVTGTGTVYYTDGTSQSYTLGFANWIDTTPTDGDTLVATTAYENRTTSGPQHTPSLFAASVPLQAGKTVAYVTLPDTSGPIVSSSTTSMHIFALGFG